MSDDHGHGDGHDDHGGGGGHASAPKKHAAKGGGSNFMGLLIGGIIVFILVMKVIAWVTFPVILAVMVVFGVILILLTPLRWIPYYAGLLLWTGAKSLFHLVWD